MTRLGRSTPAGVYCPAEQRRIVWGTCSRQHAEGSGHQTSRSKLRHSSPPVLAAREKVQQSCWRAMLTSGMHFLQTDSCLEAVASDSESQSRIFCSSTSQHSPAWTAVVLFPVPKIPHRHHTKSAGQDTGSTACPQVLLLDHMWLCGADGTGQTQPASVAGGGRPGRAQQQQ